MERSFVYVFKMYSHVHEPLNTLEYACAHRSRPEEEHGELTEKVMRRGKLGCDITMFSGCLCHQSEVKLGFQKNTLWKPLSKVCSFRAPGHDSPAKRKSKLKNLSQAFASNETFDAAFHLHDIHELSPLKL